MLYNYEKNYFRIWRLMIYVFVLLSHSACFSQIQIQNPSAIKITDSNEVNAAFSQSQFRDTLPTESFQDPDHAPGRAETMEKSNFQIFSILPDYPVTTVFQSGKQSILAHSRTQARQDDPPVLVKKRLPFWKVALGILLCLLGIGIVLYALYGAVLLFAISLLLLAFGANFSLLLPGAVGLFLLALIAIVLGLFTSVAGYNLLLRDKSKRIMFRRRKKA